MARRKHPIQLTLAFLLLVGSMAHAQDFDHSHAVYTSLLETYVKDGSIDYAQLKNNRTSLDAYLTELAGVKPATFRSWTESQRLAYLINLYNADTLQLIIDHYPVKSIKKIGGFFKSPWKLGVVQHLGKTITLDELEHEIIRKDYNEPLVHVALVCAARACPPLRSEAYVAGRLEKQLADQMRTFLANPAKNRIVAGSGKIYLSKIFKWYGEDFTKNGTTLLGSLAPYWPEPAAAQYQARRDWGIKYTDYDWSLNGR